MSDGPSTEAVIGLSIGTAIPGLWCLFCPPVLDTGQYDLEVVRLQQVKAVAASLGLGAVASTIARKPWPFLVAVAITGLLLCESECGRKRCPA